MCCLFSPSASADTFLEAKWAQLSFVSFSFVSLVNLVLDNTLLGRNQIAQENNMKLAEGEEFDELLSLNRSPALHLHEATSRWGSSRWR